MALILKRVSHYLGRCGCKLQLLLSRTFNYVCSHLFAQLAFNNDYFVKIGNGRNCLVYNKVLQTKLENSALNRK